MSESQQFYKKYLAAKSKSENSKRKDSNYVDDYEREERISRLEWKEKDREEKDDNERSSRLFGNIY